MLHQDQIKEIEAEIIKTITIDPADRIFIDARKCCEYIIKEIYRSEGHTVTGINKLKFHEMIDKVQVSDNIKNDINTVKKYGNTFAHYKKLSISPVDLMAVRHSFRDFVVNYYKEYLNLELPSTITKLLSNKKFKFTMPKAKAKSLTDQQKHLAFITELIRKCKKRLNSPLVTINLRYDLQKLQVEIFAYILIENENEVPKKVITQRTSKLSIHLSNTYIQERRYLSPLALTHATLLDEYKSALFNQVKDDKDKKKHSEKTKIFVPDNIKIAFIGFIKSTYKKYWAGKAPEIAELLGVEALQKETPIVKHEPKQPSSNITKPNIPSTSPKDAPKSNKSRPAKVSKNKPAFVPTPPKKVKIGQVKELKSNKVYELTIGMNHFGRLIPTIESAKQKYRIEDSSEKVSRNHFSIEVIKNDNNLSYYIIDNNSTNGTAINGFQLKSNQKIQLKGNSKIELSKGIITLLFKK